MILFSFFSIIKSTYFLLKPDERRIVDELENKIKDFENFIRNLEECSSALELDINYHFSDIIYMENALKGIKIDYLREKHLSDINDRKQKVKTLETRYYKCKNDLEKFKEEVKNLRRIINGIFTSVERSI
ncbi:hypothetical protein EDEG_03085 [Edhazardia aedis USNM 41457]|uniref:Biogenesis of lysosome-related organelles complex 1 subunit BLI1 n=1 Tax=Edhazardia aedis (strain USNM 41457) TaxID=1003232 RepID=J9D4M2_EDHAE|nr:hypothetical protein EDEG_03085 [Edhazardia aedis USNM 41457]|eukprot:EJW02499.1 hypothetical protein EDEG_03085 [Edhazardia aedis USNM 41457]